jgi:hypothetical protein
MIKDVCQGKILLGQGAERLNRENVRVRRLGSKTKIGKA